MGGGDYKERERACLLSHCHSAGDLVQSCPPRTSPVFVFGHKSFRGNFTGFPFPVRSPPLRLALCTAFASSRPRLPCHSLSPPQPGFSSLPVSVVSNLTPCSLLPCPFPSPSSTSISRSPTQSHPTLTPVTLVHASPANRTVPQLGSLPSHVGNGHPPLQISDLVSIKHSLASLLPITPPSSSM